MCAQSRSSKPGSIGSQRQLSQKQLLDRWLTLVGQASALMYDVETQLQEDGFWAMSERARVMRSWAMDELGAWLDLVESLLTTGRLNSRTSLSASPESTTASPE